MEALDLSFVGGASVPDEDSGDEHGQEPEPWATVAAP